MAPVARRDYEWKDDFPRGEWWHEDVPQMLEKLSPRQRTYIAARTRGISKTKATEQVASTPQTTARWEDAPWWEPACAKERETLFGDKTAQLMPVVADALGRLKDEIAGRHGDELAHASAVYVLDQAWGKAQSNIKQEVKGDQAALAGGVVGILRALADARSQMDGPQAEVVEVLPLPKGDVPSTEPLGPA